ncbi:hypothetical protein L6452_30819 [Arctium lappa]|uniref:Uncharacterized protein n=1 Tax=Arctium lappa TaxID=4217 RepID=A0ACB8ZJK3_ARCLA|nr:hypothetical protein L6452_30819 [Arctium lappa]
MSPTFWRIRGRFEVFDPHEAYGESKVVIEELPSQASPEMKRSRKPVKNFASSLCKKQLMLEYIDTGVGAGIEVPAGETIGVQPNEQGNFGEIGRGVQANEQGHLDETGGGGVEATEHVELDETGMSVQAAEEGHIPNAVDETGGVQSAEEGVIPNALYEAEVGYIPKAVDETLSGEHPPKVEVEARQDFDPFGDFDPF